MNTLIPSHHSIANLVLRRTVWLALAVLLASNLPQFLCTRLNGDATYYDLQVQCIREGGVLYRDMFEPNLPGAVWTHMFVRAIAGWTPVALRAFDLLVVGGIAAILLWRRSESNTDATRNACLALSVAWFYLSLTAWSQCQRDTWMLLPALAALALRERAVENPTKSLFRSLGWSVVEGALWGCAFWIKPHVSVPAVLVLATGYLCSGRRSRSAREIGGVLVGGLLAGAVGSGWLIAQGAWPHFWETLLEWNPEYLASRGRWNPWPRYLGLLRSFAPWSWAHFVAVPYAVTVLVRSIRLAVAMPTAMPKPETRKALLAAIYLGWMGQSLLLQHAFSYVHVPGVILAIAVVADITWPVRWALVPQTATVAAFAAALFASQSTRPERLAAWRDCLLHGPTLASRATLQARPGPYWSYYPPVVDFLRQQGVRDKDVLVFSSMLVPLYRDLDLRPPNRFVLTDVLRGFFASRREEIRAAIERSEHRFIVSDLSETGLSVADLAETDPATGFPRAFPERLLSKYPATQPVVFRSGWFVVHAARDARGL